MPLYAYKCSSCSHEFQIFHLVDDKATECIKCLSSDIKKVFSGKQSIKIEDKKDTPQKRIEKYIEETRVAVAEQMAEARKEI